MKKIAVVNDISGFGKCSLSAAIPIISALKVQACPLPTAVLSNQTCYESFYIKDLTTTLDNIIDKWLDLNFSFDGIYVGFLSHYKQVKCVKRLIDNFKSEGVKFILDPVMGDDGKPYANYSEELKDCIFNIAKRADIVIPNVTELYFLLKKEPDYFIKNNDINSIKSAAIELSQKLDACVIVTGVNIHENGNNFLSNVIALKGSVNIVKKIKALGSYSGTGDIMASIVSAMTVRGFDITTAVETASDFIIKSINDTIGDNIDTNDGVNFENNIDLLTKI